MPLQQMCCATNQIRPFCYALEELHSYLSGAEELQLSKFVSGIGNTWSDLYFFII